VDEDTQSKHHAWNLHQGGCDDREGLSLSPEEPGLKAFRSNMFIIQFLPTYLADSARAWLDHLPRNMIDSWENLKEIFTGNFQGTYVQHGNPWDLKSCR
jgi:hypothetical protein